MPETHAARPSTKTYRGTVAQALWVYSLYQALAILFFGRALAGHFSDYFVGRESDPSQMMWLMRWWPFALAHHLNPFLTDYVWDTVGFNFAWMTSIPFPAFVTAPLTYTIGLVPTYNILVLICAPTAALAAYALCRRITDAFWPSMLGGFVFGFSSYMAAQTLGHMCLVLIFPVPLAAYACVRWFQNSIGTRGFVFLLTAMLAAEFLTDMEVFATATLLGGIAWLVGLRYADPAARGKLLAMLPPMALSFAITIVAVSPFLYYFFAFPGLRQPIWPSEKFSIDLLNFLIPTPVNWAGDNRWLTSITSSFTGTMMERDGFIGLPLVLITFDWARRHWREPLCKTAAVSLIVVCVAAIGPFLQILGHVLLPMPWLVVARMPLLEHALPGRLMGLPFLPLAVIVAMWLSDPATTAMQRGLAAASTVLLMLPNPSARFWASPINTPSFFTTDMHAEYLTRDDIVMTLPWGVRGTSMQWQAECGMCFRNVSGWTGLERFEVRRWPIVNYLLGSRDLPEAESQLKSFLANNRVTAIVMDNSNVDAPVWQALLATLDIKPVSVGGVSLYRISPDLLAAYRGASGLSMERRADELRLQIMIEAAEQYAEQGGDLREISNEKLIGLGLLPKDWIREPKAMLDYHVLPWNDRGVTLLEMGSPSAMRPLLQMYGAHAGGIYLPFPHLIDRGGRTSRIQTIIHNAMVPPAAMPIDGESMLFAGIAFDREQLRRATLALHESGKGFSRDAIPRAAVRLSSSRSAPQ